MAQKKRGLGRGLDALLGPAGGQPADGELRHVPLDLLERGPFQPREAFDPEALAELASSIRAQGVVQPIIVRALAEGRYQIVAGERRWRAAGLAGLAEVPVLVRDIPDQSALALALIENIQRENLSPLEEARALVRLTGEFGLTHQQAADAVGRSRPAVSNLLRLLELDPQVQELVQGRGLEMGHARALLALPATLQREAAQQIQLRGLSVRETESLVKRMLAPAAPRPVRPAADPDVRRLEERLSARLGARVALEHKPSGKGRLVIHYNSLDELDGILGHVG